MGTTISWDAPHEVDDAALAFGGNVRTLLPPMDVIPEEFHEWGNPWVALMSEWFFKGLPKRPQFKPGIDPEKAMRHLRTCLASWEPKHEHKEAGVAYLLSLWCVSPKIPK